MDVYAATRKRINGVVEAWVIEKVLDRTAALQYDTLYFSRGETGLIPSAPPADLPWGEETDVWKHSYFDPAVPSETTYWATRTRSGDDGVPTLWDVAVYGQVELYYQASAAQPTAPDTTLAFNEIPGGGWLTNINNVNDVSPTIPIWATTRLWLDNTDVLGAWHTYRHTEAQWIYRSETYRPAAPASGAWGVVPANWQSAIPMPVVGEAIYRARRERVSIEDAFATQISLSLIHI